MSSAWTYFSGVQSEDELERTIFIRNILFETTANDLRKRFSDYGAVEFCAIVSDRVTGRSKGSAFVRFVSTASVAAVLAQIGYNAETGLCQCEKNQLHRQSSFSPMPYSDFFFARCESCATLASARTPSASRGRPRGGSYDRRPAPHYLTGSRPQLCPEISF